MHRSPLALERRRRRARRALGAVAVAAVGALTPACGDEQPGAGDPERFCGEIAADVDAIVAPSLLDETDLDDLLDRYRRLGELAPLAIEDDWAALVVNFETASTVVPSDPASVQRAVAQAYATERSAVAVRTWLLRNCAVDIGPVATITPHDPVQPRLDPVDEIDTGSSETGTSDDAP